MNKNNSDEILSNISDISKLIDAKNIKVEINPTEIIAKDILTDKMATDIVSDFAKKNNTDILTALIAITSLTQAGGTNSSKVNLTRTVNNIEFDISDLRNIIRVHSKDSTVRKLAKTLRDSIAFIAVNNLWPGPLYKEIQRLNPQMVITPQDACFCCEIHSDNYNINMPPKIRESLQLREQRLRDIRLTTIRKSKKRGKRKSK